jgi:glutaredoxin-like protein NrdH
MTKEKAMNQCPVKLFALSTCSHCRDAKDLLNQCHINYDCVDIDTLGAEERKKVIDELKQVNPECGLPTLVVGDQVVVGFREDKIKEVLGIK